MQGRLESSIESSVNTYAVSQSIIVRKLNNASDDGWPDRLYLSREGRHFYIEFKREGEIPRKLQIFRIWTLCTWNCDVYVIDNVKEGKNVIDYYARGAVGTPPVSRARYQDYDPTVRCRSTPRPRPRKDKL